MIKIAVTGPHCCGKSTVLKMVQDNLKNENQVEFLKFSGKESPIDYSSSISLKNNRLMELDITFWMLMKMIDRELNFEYNMSSEKDICVLDRCIIDQIVYPSALLKERDLTIIKNFIKLWINAHPYDVILYIPKNPELLKKYGKKDKSIEYLDKIEDLYLKILDELKCKYFILPNNQKEQVDFIVTYLKKCIVGSE